MLRALAVQRGVYESARIRALAQRQTESHAAIGHVMTHASKPDQTAALCSQSERTAREMSREPGAAWPAQRLRW